MKRALLLAFALLIARAASAQVGGAPVVTAPPDSFRPPLVYAQLTVSASQLNNLFSTPVVLFPATAGTAYVVEWGTIAKAGGGACTIGTAGNYSIQAGALNLFGPNSPAGYFDQASTRTTLWQGYGQNGVYPSLLFETQLVNTNIQLQQLTANMSGCGTGLVINVAYRVYKP